MNEPRTPTDQQRLCIDCREPNRSAATHIAIDAFGYRRLNTQMCSKHAYNARRRGERMTRIADAKERDW